jgi:hypothetical protein
MAKKKSKKNKNSYVNQKIETAHIRNEYFKRLKEICDMIHPDLYGRLLPPHKQALFMFRGTPVKIISSGGKVAERVMQFANEYAKIVQKHIKLHLYKDGPEISIKDYVQIIFPLELLVAPRDEQHFSASVPLSEHPWYDKFKNTVEEREDEYYEAMRNIRDIVKLFMSDLRYMLFYTDFNFSVSKGIEKYNNFRMRPEISIRAHRPERRKIKLPNGETRSGIRVTLISPHENEAEDQMFAPVSLPPAEIGVKSALGKMKIPVYVTEHALNRIEERLDDQNCKFYQHTEIMTAIYTASSSGRTVIHMRDNRIMVEFRIFDLKVGYLVVSIQDGVMLVRTFLFITNANTPEGKILHEQSGLDRLDNQYLGIDKLSAFTRSDILENDDICEIFRKAGCSSLLELSRTLKNDPNWKQDTEEIQLAAQMREYMSEL